MRVPSQPSLALKRHPWTAGASLGFLSGALVFAALASTRSSFAPRLWPLGSERPCSLTPELIHRLEHSISASASPLRASATRRILGEDQGPSSSQGKGACVCAQSPVSENQRLAKEIAQLKTKLQQQESTGKKLTAEKSQLVKDKERTLEELLGLRKQLEEGHEAMAALAKAQSREGETEKSLNELLKLMKQRMQEKDKAVERLRVEMRRQGDEKDRAAELLAAENGRLVKEKKAAEDLLRKSKAGSAQPQDVCLSELKKTQDKLTAAELQLEAAKSSRLKVQSKLDTSKEQLKALDADLKAVRQALTSAGDQSGASQVTPVRTSGVNASGSVGSPKRPQNSTDTKKVVPKGPLGKKAPTLLPGSGNAAVAPAKATPTDGQKGAKGPLVNESVQGQGKAQGNSATEQSTGKGGGKVDPIPQGRTHSASAIQ